MEIKRMSFGNFFHLFSVWLEQKFEFERMIFYISIYKLSKQFIKLS